MEFNLSNIALNLIVTSFIFILLRRLYRLHNTKFPINWPVIGMFPTIIANNHRILDHVTDILQTTEQYTYLFKGPWFSGMNLLFTSNPANVNHIFNSNFANYPKGEEYGQVFEALGDGILNSDGEEWMAQRKLAHALVSDPRYRSSLDKCTKAKLEHKLLPLLNQMIKRGVEFDLSDIFMRLSFDTLCTTVCGVNPGCLSSEFPTIQFAKAIDNMLDVFLFRHKVPMAWWKLLRWLGVGIERKMAGSLVVIDNFIGQVIHDRRCQGYQKIKEDASVDLLTLYMNSTQSNDKFLRDTLLGFLIAGKDSIGVALTWFFWLLAKNPDAEKNILKELSKLRTHSNSTAKDDDEMTLFDAEEIEDLVYLHAAICESLRLYPSLPFNHKVASNCDVLPSGHRVKPGMKIIISMYSMGRMEGIWGADCSEFKPERWITENGKLRLEPSYKFTAFNAGPRLCLGKNMAMTMMKVVVAAVIYNFNIQVAQGHVPVQKLSIALLTDGLMVKMMKRKNSDI